MAALWFVLSRSRRLKIKVQKDQDGPTTHRKYTVIKVGLDEEFKLSGDAAGDAVAFVQAQEEIA
jgi:hypothetical protein